MAKSMSDFGGISRLQEEQEKTLKNCESMIAKWEKFKDDYTAVEKLLDDLPRKTTHDVMVPIGPLAFMPGNLIHTNEIMVLLGDNWFAERSATQAVEIAKRRLKSVEEYLGNLYKERENILSHMAFTTDVAHLRNQNDVQEIKEELTEKDRERQEMRLRRVAHAKATKHSVQKVHIRSNSGNGQTKSKEDINLFARLDELEKQERINKELENEQYFTDLAACSTINSNESTHTENETKQTSRAESKTPLSSSNFRVCSSKERARSLDSVKDKNSLRSESCSFVKEHVNTCTTNPCSTQNEQDDRSRFADTPSVVEANKSNDLDKKQLGKKVKWKEIVIEEESGDKVSHPKGKNATIHFTHSVQPAKPQERQEQGIMSPADILNEYLSKKETTSQHSKNKQSATTETPELKQDTSIEEKLVQACGDVVEHKNAETTSACNEKHKEQNLTGTRKVSKFKARRMENK